MIDTHFNVVVGTDFSKMAGRAVDQALELATLHDRAEVHVVYVQPDPWVPLTREGALEIAIDADTALGELQRNVTDHVERMAAGLNKKKIRRVVTHFRHGAAAQHIAQLAADLDADLVVVGSHGAHGAERFFLGSVAEHVSHLARCPVWIVRPKAHSTATRVPEIEPTCPDCLVARRESAGTHLWCARHSEHHLRAQGYAYTTEGIYSSQTSAYASTPAQA